MRKRSTYEAIGEQCLQAILAGKQHEQIIREEINPQIDLGMLTKAEAAEVAEYSMHLRVKLEIKRWRLQTRRAAHVYGD